MIIINSDILSTGEQHGVLCCALGIYITPKSNTCVLGNHINSNSTIHIFYLHIFLFTTKWCLFGLQVAKNVSKPQKACRVSVIILVESGCPERMYCVFRLHFFQYKVVTDFFIGALILNCLSTDLPGIFHTA